MLDDKDFVDKNTLGELLLDDAFIDIGAIDRQRIIKGFKDAINDPTNGRSVVTRIYSGMPMSAAVGMAAGFCGPAASAKKSAGTNPCTTEPINMAISM